MSKATSTRLNILQKAFDLIYKKGYRNTSIDDILATTEVTKGAFFYHFKNKDDMALKMISEVMHPGMHSSMVSPLRDSDEPETDIHKMMTALLLENPFFGVAYGCPVVNMIDELSSHSELFHEALLSLSVQWQDAIIANLENGKDAGKIRREINTRDAAVFIIAGYGGIRNLGKLFGREYYKIYLEELKLYLKSLR